jgi:hypothetical protein
LQREDKAINWIIQAKEENKRPDWQDISAESKEVKFYWTQWERLEFKDGVLKRKWHDADSEKTWWQTLLPRSLREEAFKQLHGVRTAAHLGIKKTLYKFRDRFTWYGMTSEVTRHVQNCDICSSRKSPTKKRRAPMKKYRVGNPMERIAADILGPLPRSNKGNEFVLVVSDYFTRWTEAYPLRNQEAETVARKIVTEFLCRFGSAFQFHSDQGTNFESHLMAEVCKLMGIEKTRTTPFIHSRTEWWNDLTAHC